MKEPCVLAIDIGTTSLKAALVSKTGWHRRVRISYKDGGEKDRAALRWPKALKKAVKVFNGQENHIRAICISGNGPTIVSKDGRTLLWNDSVRDLPPYPLPLVLNGCSEYSRSIFLPRIKAYLDKYPDVVNRGDAPFILSGPEYLSYRLTGNAVTVLPEERYRGAYWDSKALSALGITPNALPHFISPLERVGTLTEEAREYLSLEKGAALPPVYCAGPDFIAAMIGTNSLTAGKMYDCAGSSEGVNVVIDDSMLEAIKDREGIRLLPSVLPHLWNVAVMIEESGSIFVNYRRIVEAVLDNKVPYKTLIEKCLANKNSDGYEILCHIAKNFKDAVCTLECAKGCEPIVVTGGQAKSDEWMQMKSNIAKVSLARVKCPDAELFGCGVVAWTAEGEYKSIKDAAMAICKIDKVYTPIKQCSGDEPYKARQDDSCI